MIRVYLQYSYGGFKTFAIQCEPNELVNAEVTNDNRHGFPSDADCYFQYGGAKMVYRYLDNGELDLVVREIPSIHKDGDGRSIPCAVQFVGDASDRNTLDHMALDIANNLQGFHDFFAYLFRVRGGLHIEGDRLAQWITGHESDFICESPSAVLSGLNGVKDGILLFVPLSDNYGRDAIVTRNVSGELHLPESLAQSHRYLHLSELSQMQGQAKITAGVQRKPATIGEAYTPTKPAAGSTTTPADDQLQQKLAACQKERNELEKRANDYFSELKATKQQLADKEQHIRQLTALLARHKKLALLLGGTTLLLAACSVYLVLNK